MTAEDVKNRVVQHLAKLPYVLWENQFNLIDSHDTSRLHNNPKVNLEEYRGAVIFQFMLPGAVSIYYGDEAEIDGYIDSMEGCRFPMPWEKDIDGCQSYHLIKALAHMKAQHPALSRGSMKILYAEGNILSIARFWEQEVFICVISTEDENRVIRLPLGAVGAVSPCEDCDVFGRLLTVTQSDEHSVTMVVKAHQSYFFRCDIM